MWRKFSVKLPRIEVKREREREGCSRGRWRWKIVKDGSGEAVGRKNRGSALVKEIIRGLIKYSAISSASIAGCWLCLSGPSRNPTRRREREAISPLLFENVSNLPSCHLRVEEESRHRRRNWSGLGGGRIRNSKIHAELSTLTLSQSRGREERRIEMGLGWTNPVVKFSLN